MFIDFPVIDAKMEGLDQVVLPRMVRIRQKYDPSQIRDVPRHLARELEAQDVYKRQIPMRRSLTHLERHFPEYPLG